jgi:hypothetical protein
MNQIEIRAALLLEFEHFYENVVQPTEPVSIEGSLINGSFSFNNPNLSNPPHEYYAYRVDGQLCSYHFRLPQDFYKKYEEITKYKAKHLAAFYIPAGCTMPIHLDGHQRRQGHSHIYVLSGDGTLHLFKDDRETIIFSMDGPITFRMTPNLVYHSYATNTMPTVVLNVWHE